MQLFSERGFSLEILYALRKAIRAGREILFQMRGKSARRRSSKALTI